MGMNKTMHPLALLLIVISSVAASAALTAGTWGGTHWKIVVNDDQTTGTIEGDCSLGSITDFSSTNSVVTFNSTLTLQFEDTETSNVTCSDGALDSANTTLTGNIVVGSFTEAFRVTLNAEPDLYKCVNSATSAHLTTNLLAATALLATYLWRG